LSSFFDKASLSQKKPITLFIDNNGVIKMIKTYKEYRRAKHIDIQYHFVKEKVEAGEFKPVYIPSEDNIADLLTKALLRNVTCNFTSDLGLWNTIRNSVKVKSSGLDLFSFSSLFLFYF